MIIANIIKENVKVGGIDIIIANVSLEKNNGFSVLILVKDMHQMLQIEFKNCPFFSF